MTDVLPVHREVVVPLGPSAAFELFTDGIGKWWPVAQLSVFGADADVSFEEGKIVETSGAESSVWGTVTHWEPGLKVSFTWHPGRDPARPSLVSVSFVAQSPDQTLVVLEHSGWESFDDPQTARDEYNDGWPMVLDCYREIAG